MNRYPVWKYILIVIALLFGALYTAPNYFVESPALQVTTGSSTLKITRNTADQVEAALAAAGIKSDGVSLDGNGNATSVRARFSTTDVQLKAKDALEKALNRNAAEPDYIVTVNLVKNTPKWMQAINALPMNLGLDLRGGVHFLMQVDVAATTETKIKGIQSSVRSQLRDKDDARHTGIDRVGQTIEVRFADASNRTRARQVLASESNDLVFADAADANGLKLVVSLKPQALQSTIEEGVKQNISTLSKRVNELGVSEPIIQQQGRDRIVVQLPGVQDVARAKAIIGRTATLEMRLVDDTVVPGMESAATIPLTSELFTDEMGRPIVLLKDVILTGDYISSAIGTNDQNNQPAVGLDLNGDGGGKMRAATRERIGKRMAILLKEKGKYTVLSAPTINSELGSRFQITGMGTLEKANDLALLLRSGALSAPMEIIEERVIGPQLGAENIAKGLYSTVYGFAAIAVFMILYYHMFGAFSVIALASNLLFLLALLSCLQVTLTLPGIAAIALALGMAIDANVLINERIREELRAGEAPQKAIAAGFDRAWATILDSNVTTLIVGIALLVFGSGPVRGFAVVHCLGILTSMFSSVFVSRGVVNLWYGRTKKLNKVSIGTVWTPGLSVTK
ncbi:protein translocase subunit SecD [Massilia sp. P8910]|uniref:protein translocase subunit SecD n=1 Tax=Massilia antarctica TaxID=2765360 RepID=UPI0006BB5830|nr:MULTISPECIES: protein translocase subunit SecD [Massilia]MCE3603024.1 protein translocase subunit SecD [Massilia antarctica]MCY0915417.1 protein translocase subunit SecD [Massilia sp. H27-R4]CUI05881.1 Protein-export membrane protein SecD (TC 3.A.5.1.1) [Janthinobacterium sp. CG23_2]CUU29667.1 Protein-export membrane protein SecD (TC 3.A.5.1.1) [Janthinobacterium sp. CG23_2]